MRISLLCSLAVLTVSRVAFCDPLRIDAVDMRVRTAGGAQHRVWNLWSTGELAEFVEIPGDGEYTLTVRAHGTPLGNVWPRMEIRIDQTAIHTVVVDSATPKDFSFPFTAERGTHKVAVAFLNDAVSRNEDRNLYLHAIDIRAADAGARIVLADPREWEAAWSSRAAEMEERTVAEAREAIERIRKSDAVLRLVDSNGAPIPNANVAVRQTAHDFLFGCNIYGFDMLDTPHDNQLYKQRFEELFNYATLGFYWRSYEPERGNPRYAYTDTVIAWCAERGIRLKGHPLLWDHRAAEPVWADGQPGVDLQERRVRDIVSRYKGKIEFWEVVNEPAHLDGVKIEAPYRWARDADPAAHLIVNDFHVMANGYPPFYELLENAVRDGVPFDGIGIQAHEPRTMRFPLDQVKGYLDRYATLGKALHITEFTPTSAGEPITASHIRGVWDEAAQADYAVKFYTVCFAHPAVVAITWWDLCDARSWLRGGGLLRADLSPKPAYTALQLLIHKDWKTSAEGKTDESGMFRFRGFHGRYAVVVEHNGAVSSGQFHLPKGPAETVDVVMR
ncbi:MAG: hypothetical protein AMXMBFR4_22350 [Candidatus Hydrogenedentota bacterium]